MHKHVKRPLVDKMQHKIVQCPCIWQGAFWSSLTFDLWLVCSSPAGASQLSGFQSAHSHKLTLMSLITIKQVIIQSVTRCYANAELVMPLFCSLFLFISPHCRRGRHYLSLAQLSMHLRCKWISLRKHADQEGSCHYTCTNQTSRLSAVPIYAAATSTKWHMRGGRNSSLQVSSNMGATPMLANTRIAADEWSTSQIWIASFLSPQ